MDLTAARDDQDVLRTEVQTVNNKIINTTVGRVILNERCRRRCRSSTAC